MKQSRLESELRDAICSLRPNFMATMNYSRPLSGGRDTRHQTVVRHLREWNREVLEALFGRKFFRRNVGDEFLFVAAIEIGPLLSKEHAHLLVRVPDHLAERFEVEGVQRWRPKEMAPAMGQHRRLLESDVLIRRIYDLDGAVGYCLKNVGNHTDRIVFSNEFRVTAH